jgi:1-acyl-sn-glycerol-3-phosphate acyltransferase
MILVGCSMRYLRATFRLLLLLILTFGYYLLYVAGLALVFAFAKPRILWRNRCFGGWARAATRIIRLKINRLHAPPSAPFLLVSNHLSYIDVVVLQTQSDCAFVAKKELAGWPILGSLCRTMDTIFIDRTVKRDIPHVLTKIERTLERGLGVVLFAEGTSTSGHSVSPFKSSLLEFAARNRVPVYYASISYVTPADEAAAEQSVCWWGDMTFKDHVFRLFQMKSFEANVVYGPAPVVADDRRVLAAKLWSAVSSQLTPVKKALKDSKDGEHSLECADLSALC